MTRSERALVAVGSFPSEAVQGISEGAAALGLGTRFVVRCDEAADEAGHGAPAVLLAMDAPGAEHTLAQVRSRPGLAALPVLGVTRAREDLAFGELFAWGGDDLLGPDAGRGLVRRLRSLLATTPPAADAEGPSPRLASAVVASADARWRGVMGRALHDGGYAVRFVTTAADLEEEALREDVALVVSADDVAGEGAVAVAGRAITRGAKAAWIVVAPPKRMPGVHAAVRSLPRAATMDGFAPPQNALFLANELLAVPGKDQRSSARLLYGTSVTFRQAGRDDDDVGYSYNISENGLYVRTLAPLDPGQEVWLDLWAPRSNRRVRLAGVVAWACTFGSRETATVPPGFGVRIVDGLAGDLERWRAGYRALKTTLFGAAA